ncbi:CaiB/BaiF CoA transferase family protein [Arthrobacter sp. B6]|uniref:CaiB/BaiF CoA transferase family protein n=1 Tax=Arthrobacter sp. B6 TaxID=1570137 RepID=UPI000831AB34|nr:CaiB/BaiF CoA-transferase family protein [Arthrobacter sp. B6]
MGVGSPSEQFGPLTGLRVLELGGIGPAPFGGMLLRDLGAEVTRIERVEHVDAPDISVFAHSILTRGRRSIALDITTPEGVAAVMGLIGDVDVLIEGFRPGVLERLGFAPETLWSRNPRLVIGRMTGWGQDGPLSAFAGHDINYLAVSGVLGGAVGPDGTPVAPLNMLGDFAGGGLLLAFGVLAAVHEATRTGTGQIVDAAIVDGVALFTAMLHAMRRHDMWDDGDIGGNLFDGGAPFYGVFRTRDDQWLAVGAIEPQFYNRFIDILGLSDQLNALGQHDKSHWAQTRALFVETIAERTQSDWLTAFDGVDACVSPVVRPADVLSEVHLDARRVYTDVDGMIQPAPAPRFSRYQTMTAAPTVAPGADTVAVLRNAGFDDTEIDSLIARGVARQRRT